MKEVIFKLPDDVLSLIIHKVENTPQEASLLEKWIYDGDERKTGKWIVWKDCEGKTRELTCSECGCQRRTWVNQNYCEDCGSKMEVDK